MKKIPILGAIGIILICSCVYSSFYWDTSTAECENTIVVGGIQYSLTSADGVNGTAEMIGWDGESTQIMIPSKIHSTITIDGDSAELDFEVIVNKAIFKDNVSIKSLTIPDGDGTVTLWPEMFSGCSELTTVTLGNVIDNIPAKCFCDNPKLETVNWSDALKSIGNNAFQNCRAMKDVKFNEGLISIGSYAFESCKSLTTLEFPESLTTIGANAFATTLNLGASPMSVNKVSFGNKLSSLGNNAFMNCQFTKVSLPDTLTSFSYTVSATPWPISLESIEVSATHTTLSSIDGVLYDKKVAKLLVYPFGKTGSYSMPDTVSSLQTGVLVGTKITDIHISAGLKALPTLAFKDCTELKSLDLSNYTTLKTAVSFAQGCTALTTVTFNDNLTALPNFAFDGCSSLNITHLPKGLTSIGNGAFRGTAIQSITVGEYEKQVTVGKGVFYDCNELIHIKFDNITVSSANYGMLANGTKLTTIEYAEGFDLWTSDGAVQKSNDGATWYSVLGGVKGEIVVPKEVTKLTVDSTYGSTFANAINLTTIVFEDGRTTKLSIGNGMFSGCSSLEKIVFSSNISLDGSSIFSGCDLLKYLSVPTNDFTVSGNTFTANGYEYYHFNGVESAKAPTSEELLGTIWISEGDKRFVKIAELIDGATTFITFNISFNVDGVDKISAEYGSEVTKPADPVKTGYTFVNWYSDEALETVYEFATMPAENITLYAKWIKATSVSPSGEVSVSINSGESFAVTETAKDVSLDVEVTTTIGKLTVNVGDSSKIPAGAVVSADLKTVANPSEKLGTAYEFDFKVDGTSLNVKMQVTVPYSVESGKDAKVYWVNGDVLQEMKVISFTDSSVTFETEHNSIYLVTSEEPVSDNTLMVIAAIIVVVAIFAIGMIVVIKRIEKNSKC